MPNKEQILLTIAIPTFNRAKYLRLNLEQLRSELSGLDETLVEIVVSDNCSEDDTSEVVDEFQRLGFPIRYFRNETNLGWGLNFFKCYGYALGKYVLILGDDDLLVDGSIELILDRLVGQNYGVVFLRPYGFDKDFRKEYPGSRSVETIYSDTDGFLMAVSPMLRLISASIVNKELSNGSASQELTPGNFAHLHLILHAALASENNLFIDQYLVASKRNNSADFNFSKLYVEEFWQLLESYIPRGLKPETIRKLENRMLLTYYPYYMLKERYEDTGDHRESLAIFSERFEGRLLFNIWVAPILKLPKPLAVLWGAFATLIGRTYNGELTRGLSYAWKYVLTKFS